MNLLHAITEAAGVSRPLWRDYSYWQTIVNFDIARANGVHGMFARSSINTGYIDPYFARNWSEAGRVGVYRSSYHVIWPGSNIQSQVDNWFNAHPELDILPGNIPIPRVIDLEVSRYQSHQRIATDTWNMSELVLARDGVRPIIYSRYLLINDWLRTWSADMLNEHYFWLAQYLSDPRYEHPGPPTLPSRVSRARVILHQTADKKPGFPGESSSSAIDYNRWCVGDETNMHFWLSETWGTEPEPEPPYISLPEVPMQKLVISPLADKVIFHLGVPLTGKSNGIPVDLPGLPPEVKGLDIRLVVWGDKGGMVSFGNGQASTKQHRVAQWVGATSFEPPFHENNGFCPLDGNKLWRQHDAGSGTIFYALVINAYYVEMPDLADLTGLIEKLSAVEEKLDTASAELENVRAELDNAVMHNDIVQVKKA